MSAFWRDGYEDGLFGRPQNEPDAITRSDGRTTNIAAIEYREGYAAGKAAAEHERGKR